MSRKRKLSENQELEIIKIYQNSKDSLGKIGERYGISDTTALTILRRHCIVERHIPTFKLNHSFFKKIDTEAKAYFLGLMYADGCVIENRKFIYIGLQERDKDILDKFIEALDSNIIPYFIDKKNPKHQNQYRIRFTSKEMFYDLLDLGCVPRKSLILRFPTEEQVPNHLLRHFVRGYFDGDGSVKLGRRSGIDIVSTKDFCEKLKEILDKEQIGFSVIRNAKINNITHRFCIDRKLVVIKFLNWIYKDATIYMDRKHDVYKTIKSL